ncbi:Integrin alpha chain-like protein (Alpha-INT1), partial [Scheffersomyces stipitis CBS 6054]
LLASVDLLLKEMNVDPDSIPISDDYIPAQESFSAVDSPTKPLNFPRSSSKPLGMTREKEFNSSSDTCASESDVQISNVEEIVAQVEPEPTAKPSDNSFMRNFDLDDSEDAANTIAHPSHEADEFSFATPMTSTIDLNNPHAINQTVPNSSTYINTSPSRSIMKKTPANSPRKSVVFSNSNPEIHHYPEGLESTESVSSSNEEAHSKSVIVTSIPHEWSELNNNSNGKSISSDEEDGSIAPAPPPHSSKSFEVLLKNNAANNEDEAIDSQTLKDYKLKHDGYSNLSLNEKLDLFLSEKNNDPFNGSKPYNDLDEHLNNLHNAAQYKAASNIHDLSESIQIPKLNDYDNPLDSLVKSSDVQLRSSGSSQSSLPSLRDYNRTLDSINNQVGGKSLEVNDGIKGLSDDLVESLIPENEDRKVEAENDALTMKSTSTSSNREINQRQEEPSFDSSYNNNTEKSIMNLLISASSDHLSKAVEESNQVGNQETIGKEVVSNGGPKTVSVEDVSVKQENQAIPKEISVKKEQDDVQDLVSIKSENKDFVKKEGDEFTNELSDSKLESVSEILRASPVRLVKTESPVQDEDNIVAKQEISAVEEQKKNPDKVEDESFLPETGNESKMSLRFNYDSDWKLEDSHDGDREDNEDYTNNDLTAPSIAVGKKSIDFERLMTEKRLSVNLSPNESDNENFIDASEELQMRTLAPPREETKKPEEAKEVEETKPEENSDENDDKDNVLANSSNIAPPGEITLPVVETNNYSSFDEITKRMDEDSFEESLSAEHEADPKPNDFISIWHSQSMQKREHKSPDYSSTLNTETLVQRVPQADTLERGKIPASLQPKKFKEVNVMSRRVVSPDMEDLHISGFLPELSQDSGFEEHFRFLNNTGNTSRHASKNFTPLSTENVLNNIDSDPRVLEPPKPVVSIDRRGITTSNHINLVPQKVKPVKATKAKSQFKVPSFEIKRSSSVLSPRDTYNDIFDDVIKQPPTIKANGMKTLPSMDRDDVKKILSTKRVITQEEYTTVKYVGRNPQKNSIVNEPDAKYDELQQQASICNVTADSSPMQKTNSERDSILPHLADELMKAPTALLSRDQFFKDSGASDFENKAKRISIESSRAGSVVHHSPPDEFKLFDHDFEIIHTPQSTTMVVPNLPDSSVLEPIPMSPEKYQEPVSPTKKHPPIKIGSPVKLLRDGQSVTGIEVESIKKTHSSRPSFNGDELLNGKLRDSLPNDNLKSFGAVEQELNAVSTSDPSVYANGTTDVSTILRLNPGLEFDTQVGSSKDMEHGPVPLQERGRLFLRVVGFKNIELPDLKNHDAKFSLTLDNGVHCIRTPSYDLDKRNILIGKEFELTVGDSLEFILTMKATYEKPRGKIMEVKETKVVKPKNRLSRMFGQKEIITTTKFVTVDAKDSWQNKFAQDGSFARCYVDLDQYEDKITGRAQSFDITCFNEWETTSDGGKEPVRCQPYRIGQLEVKMLFIPRADAHEVLPTSIRSAYQSINELKKELGFKKEGYMHQEGGDCEVWKKRFFKLDGTSLIAHSEFSLKTRAKINLAKVVEVIYVDKENINRSNGNYRNFSDVLLVEHAFKIRFANGELIDFGAPNREEKLEWISLLEKIIYRNKFRRQQWVKLMVAENSQQSRPVSLVR